MSQSFPAKLCQCVCMSTWDYWIQLLWVIQYDTLCSRGHIVMYSAPRFCHTSNKSVLLHFVENFYMLLNLWPCTGFLKHFLYTSLAYPNYFHIWYVMLLTALNNTQLSQMLTVVVWLTLTMGKYQSLVQHTIQWPLTPVILAMFWWEMAWEHVWILVHGLAIPQHVVVSSSTLSNYGCNSFHLVIMHFFPRDVVTHAVTLSVLRW